MIVCCIEEEISQEKIIHGKFLNKHGKKSISSGLDRKRTCLRLSVSRSVKSLVVSLLLNAVLYFSMLYSA